MTTAHDDHDFQRLAGCFDQPVAPSPRFANELRERLDMATKPAAPASTIEAVAKPLASVPSGRRTETPDDLPWRAPRWMRTLEAAVAVLLVVSLAGASLFFRQPEAVYDLAFQPEDTAAAEFNYGGDAGRTWVLGDVEPEMGGFQTSVIEAVAANGLGSEPATRLIVGDSFFYTTYRISGTGDFVRHDLRENREVWATQLALTGPLASDGSRIFGISPGAGGSRTSLLAAIDIASGRIAWSRPLLSGRFTHAASLVLDGGTIYAVDFLGNAVAVDATDGSPVWQFPEDLRTPTADEINFEYGGILRTPVIATNDDAVFISRPSKSVTKLDRATGRELGTVAVLDTYGEDIISVDVSIRQDRLVIIAIHAERLDAPDDIRGHYPTDVLIFDANTLELDSRVSLEDIRGNVVLIGDDLYVPTAVEPEGEARLYRIDMTTGVLGQPLPKIAAQWDILLSASGNVLMATGDPATIAFFDLDTGELLDSVELGITNIETPFGQPVQMWGPNPIVITGMGEVYVIEDD